MANREIIRCEQGTEEWAAHRCGRVTASNFHKIVQGGATAKGYMHDVLAERMTGRPKLGFKSAAMQWGTETEPQSRARYEMTTGIDVEEVGCILLGSDIAYSPDGLVGSDGAIESKSPDTKTHLKTLLTHKVPTDYRTQCQGGLWVSERQWIDFLSFDPRVDESIQLVAIRVERDDTFIGDVLEPKVAKFLDDLEELEKRIGAPRVPVDFDQFRQPPKEPETPPAPDTRPTPADRQQVKQDIERLIASRSITRQRVHAISRAEFFEAPGDLPTNLLQRLLQKIYAEVDAAHA